MPSTTPPLFESRSPNADATVVVAGGGPSALASALGLARRGIGVVLISGPSSVDEDFGDTLILHEESLERLARLGCAQAAVGSGTTWDRSRVVYKGRDVSEEPMEAACSERFPLYTVVDAGSVTDALWDAVTREPAVEVVTGATMLSAIPRDGGVRVTLQTRDQGMRALEGAFLIAADGGRSTARGCLAVSFQGVTLPERVRYARVRAEPKYGHERRILLSPKGGGVGLVTPLAPDRWELAWLVNDESTARAEHAAGRLDASVAVLLEGADHELIACGDRTLHDRSASKAKVGPVLFAGAALRAVPALGGWDVNDALEDAESAAWRLALVLRGLAPVAMLDRYAAERTAATEASRETAEAVLRFLVPGSWTGLTARNALLSSPFGSRSRQRPAALRLWTPPRAAAAQRGVEACDGRPELADVGAVAPDGPTVLLPRRTPGRLRDHIGPEFTVVAFPATRAAGDDLGSWLASGQTAAPTRHYLIVPPEQLLEAPSAPGFDAVLVDERRTLRAGFGVADGESALFVLRPDGYVAARVCDFATTRCTEILEQVTGCHREVRESGVPSAPEVPGRLNGHQA